ncbi:MAG: acylphosphatase [Pseudomonadota bacterium]
MSRAALRLSITGRVQGVGFRYWLRDRAVAHGLAGWCRNEPDGSVSALVAGASAAVETLIRECHAGPPSARVDHVAADAADDPGNTRFEIRR